MYYEVLVTQMKAYKEQKESEKSDRETALKSALVGMSFVTNDKGEKIISRMEMILYPKKKQTIIIAVCIMKIQTIYTNVTKKKK